MATIAELLVKIGGDSSGLRKELAASQRQIKRAFGPEALAASQAAAGILTGVAVAMGAAAAASIKLAGKLNMTKKAFETLTGSAATAKQMISDIKELDDKSSFSFETYSTAAQKLLALGTAAEDVIPTLTTIGDASAALGQGEEGIDRIVLALSQMTAKGKVSAQEMNQLAENNVQGWRYLAEEMGVSVAEVMDKAEKGMINGQAAVKVILAGMEKDFKGSMDKIANETPIVLDTIVSNVQQILAGIGPAVDRAFGINKTLQKVRDYLVEFKRSIDAIGIKKTLEEMVPPGVKIAILAIAGAIIGAAIPAITSFVLAARAAIVPLLPWIAAGMALGAIAGVVWAAWEPLAKLFKALWTNIWGATKYFWYDIQQSILGALAGIFNGIDWVFKKLGVKNPLEGWTKGLNQSWQEATRNMNQGIAEMNEGWNTLVKFDYSQIGKKIVGATKEALDATKEFGKKVISGNTVKSTTGQTPNLLQSGKSTRNGIDEAARKLEDLKEKAKRVSESINDDWVRSTKTEREQLDIWYKEQLDALEAVGNANGTYYADLAKLKETYEAKLKAIDEAEAKRNQEKIEWLAKLQKTEMEMYQEKLDAAWNAGDIRAYADLLSSEQALFAQDLAGRQSLLDQYYQYWQETHRTAMDYMAETMNGLYSGLENFFVDILNNAKSIGDAWQSLRNSILAMLGQMVAKWIASQIMMKVFGATMQTTMAATSAAAAATTAAAWAPAAAAVSLASFGANAGPAMAGINSTYALATTLSAIPGLAEGGITTGPTLAEIGEGKYREAVLPLNKRYFEKVGLTGRDEKPQQSIVFSPQINTLDAKSFRQWLNDGGGDEMARWIRKEIGGFAPVGV